MTQIHEPGEAWHVGWDWHAGMWYVEPPFDVELDDPVIWKHERHEAFEFIEDWYRKQPAPEPEIPPAGEPEQKVEHNPVVEPVRVVEHGSVANTVHELNLPAQAEAKRQARIEEYKARVGIK